MKNNLNYSNKNCIGCNRCLMICPVDAIKMDFEKAYVIEDLCIGCGKCFKVCPMKSRKIKSDLGEVKEYIKRGEKVIASLDPMYAVDLSIEKSKFIGILKKMGFYKVEDTSVASKVIRYEYQKYLNENQKNINISSYCPSLKYYILKYNKSMKENIIPLKSPMILHGEYLKLKHANIKVVHIGPCMAKKYESLEVQNKGIVDKVITFEELDNWIEKEMINIDDIKVSDLDNNEYESDLFCVHGNLDINNSKYYKISGFENIDNTINSIVNKELKEGFFELSTCNGACLGGHGYKNKIGILARKENIKKTIRNKEERKEDSIYFELSKYTGFEDCIIKKEDPSNEEIDKILVKMGVDKDNHINCMSCGYSSCINKAKSIYWGYSSEKNCILNVKRNSNLITNMIFNLTSSYIFIVSEEFKIIDVNDSALKILNKEKKDLKGKYIGHYMGMDDYIDVLYDNSKIISRETKWIEQNKTLIGDIFHLEDRKTIVAIYRDITQLQAERRVIKEIRENSLKIAQTLIDRQMEVTREIASLLGESTAETKIILSRLKDIGRGVE